MAKLKQDPPLKITDFTIVIDSNESAPFHFTGIPVDSDKHNRNWIVPTVTKPLWSMGKREVETPTGIQTHGLADYSIDGMEERVQVERKSRSDFAATLGQRREAFHAEIARLNHCEFAAVVCECDWEDLLVNPIPNSQMSPKVFSRTVISWSIRYPNVHWFFCMNRRHAEVMTFQILRRFWDLSQGTEAHGRGRNNPDDPGAAQRC